MHGPALARRADARGTLTSPLQAVNRFSQRGGARNLNRGNDLPTLARVWDAIVLRRSADVAQALLVVAAAYCGALAVNAGVAYWLESAETVALPIAPDDTEVVAESATEIRGDYSIVFERNLFGSEPITPTDTPTPTFST